MASLLGQDRVRLALISTASVAAQLLLLPAHFIGPDTTSFMFIAEAQRSPGFSTDPDAFTGNFWSMGQGPCRGPTETKT